MRENITHFFQKEINKKITFSKSSFGIFHITLNNIVVFEDLSNEKVLLTIDELQVKPDFIQYLLNKNEVFQQIDIKEPSLNLVLLKTGEYNIQSGTEWTNEETFTFIHDVLKNLNVNEINVHNGELSFIDENSKNGAHLRGIKGEFNLSQDRSFSMKMKMPFQRNISSVHVTGKKAYKKDGYKFKVETNRFNIAMLSLIKCCSEYTDLHGFFNSYLFVDINNERSKVKVSGGINLTKFQLFKNNKKVQNIPRNSYLNIDSDIYLAEKKIRIYTGDMKFPEIGDLHLKGELFVQHDNKSLGLNLNVNTEKLEIGRYFKSFQNKSKQPKTYLTSHLRVRKEIESKKIDIDGLTHFINEKKDFKTFIQGEFNYENKMRLSRGIFSDVEYSDSSLPDKSFFLKIKRLHVRGLHMNNNGIYASSVDVEKPEFRMYVAENKNMQMSKTIKKAAYKGSFQNNIRRTFPLYIKSFKSHGGKVVYRSNDKRPYARNIQVNDINLSALNIAPYHKTTVNLKSKVKTENGSADLIAIGQVNFFTNEIKNLKVWFKRMPAKDYAFLFNNEIEVHKGQSDLFIKVNLDKYKNFSTTVDLDIFNLMVDFPQSTINSYELALHTLKRNGNTISFRNISINGNLNDNTFDLTSLKKAAIAKSLTSKEVIFAGVGLLGSNILLGNALTTFFTAAAPLVLPATIAVVGGSFLYTYFNKEEKYKN
ncbi:MAG: hypothetical protein HQK84_05330 [Nitrospinae bacterium]|nr:hypothetical protein [Nitrospinota bacterium]